MTGKDLYRTEKQIIYESLIGTMHGDRKIERLVYYEKNKTWKFEVTCSCGSVGVVSYWDIKNGLSKSCRACANCREVIDENNGLKFCPKCQQWIPATTEYFGRYKRLNTESRTGLQSWCRLCKKETSRSSNYMRRKLALLHYSNGKMCCECCGETEERCLTFDHIHGDGADFRRECGRGPLGQWLLTHGFPEGIQILCYNCNCTKRDSGAPSYEIHINKLLQNVSKIPLCY